ncbi:hypothetical protein EUTSA_v10023903mg, partial [Eutrema salsugineum]
NPVKGEHFLGNIILEVKVTTPKVMFVTGRDEIACKNVMRIFIARIPPSVSDLDSKGNPICFVVFLFLRMVSNSCRKHEHSLTYLIQRF